MVIVCVDERSGMLFHHRRQSQDRVVRARILAETRFGRLWMNRYSYGQFTASPPGHIQVAEDFLARAGVGDTCFVEDQPLQPWRNKIEGLLLYRWNRSYPSDFALDLALGRDWVLQSREDFAGYSHKIITKEVYLP